MNPNTPGSPNNTGTPKPKTKTKAEKLYLKLNTIRYTAMAICLALILGSVALLEFSDVPPKISILFLIIGMVGSPFAILVPQIFWCCPMCGERLKTRRRGILVKPETHCPRCGAKFD